MPTPSSRATTRTTTRTTRTRRPPPVRRLAVASLLLAVLGASACTAGTPAAAPSGSGNPTGTTGAGQAGTTERNPADLTLTAASTRPEYVTDDDVAVAVEAPGSGTAEATAAAFTVNGAPSTVSWSTDHRDRAIALVTGLRPGDNEIVATLDGRSATLKVTNHPVTGPLFSGPALPMPVCSTEAYGLGPPTDAACSAPTKTTWRYKTTTGETKPLDDITVIPSDVAKVEDGPNKGRNFIIREEAGVLNRSIYWINVLDPEPAATTSASAFADANDAWNGRLVYQFGGGCGTTYTQGFLLLSSAPDNLMALGYATATGTLNTFQVMCNDVLSAETALVVKEHFSETFGVPRYTIGSGGSGGAIQQYLIAQNYPGILDAVGATLPFPDALSIAPGVVDCVLLNNYYRTDQGKPLTDEQRAAVNGHLSTKTCDFWERTFAQNIKPDTGCALDILGAAGDAVKGLPTGASGSGIPKLPEDLRYDPENNRSGLRCTLQDGLVNVLGKDPATGFAYRPLDNTGVQYGLEAVNAGTISVDEFLELNERIGGADGDGRLVPDRMATSEAAIRPVYESGRVIQGGGALDDIPIITVNVFTDEQGDIHDRFRAFSLRDRLDGTDGTPARNHMVWTRGIPAGQTLIDALTGTVDVGSDLVDNLDRWLTALDEQPPGDQATRLDAARPDTAVDNCLVEGVRTSGFDLYERPGPCRDGYPIHGDSRTAAGAPRRNDIGKCQLQTPAEALAAKVLATELTAAQRSRYETIFASGVCDWSKPGVGQVPSKGPWQSFGS